VADFVFAFVALTYNVTLCKEKADKRFKGIPLFYYITLIIGSGLVSSFLLEKRSIKKAANKLPTRTQQPRTNLLLRPFIYSPASLSLRPQGLPV
jgi:hypothetical protein